MEEANASDKAAAAEIILIKLATGDLICFMWYFLFFSSAFCINLLAASVPPSRRPPRHIEILLCYALPLFIPGLVPFVFLYLIGQWRVAFSQMPFVWGKPSFAFDGYYAVFERSCLTNARPAATVVFMLKMLALDISPYLAIIWPVANFSVCVYNFASFCLYRLKEPEKYKSLLRRVGIKDGKLDSDAWKVVLLAGYKYLSNVPRHRVGYARVCLECLNCMIAQANDAAQRREKAKTIDDAEKGLWFYEKELELSEDSDSDDTEAYEELCKIYLKERKTGVYRWKAPLHQDHSDPVRAHGTVHSNALADSLKTLH